MNLFIMQYDTIWKEQWGGGMVGNAEYTVEVLKWFLGDTA